VEWNSKLFLFGGLDAASFLVRMYDPQQAKWVNMQNAPFLLGRIGAVFTWENRIFVLSNIGQLWEYEPNQDRWQLRTTYPGKTGFGHPVAEVIGNKAYLGLYRATQELWELDLETLKWKTKNQIIGLPQSITSGHFQHNGSIYFLRTPEEPIIGSLTMELYKFDPDAI
jgi:N-acetylneuraminic acid mutarotase